MVYSKPVRLLAVTALALSSSLLAQSPGTPQTIRQTRPSTPAPQPSSSLPPTQPTTPAQPALPLVPAQLPPQRAQVTYTHGTLSVTADNASLNQILRQIASDTGMKITGGVIDERVFGQYGPAKTSQVLAALLDGTSSNMILVHGERGTPAELILTPRHGGATPPNPNAASFDDRSQQQDPPVQAVQPDAAPAPSNPPISPPVTPASPPTETPPSSQPDSPNGVKTPQQIYEQLQRMRQQPTQTTQPQLI